MPWIVITLVLTTLAAAVAAFVVLDRARAAVPSLDPEAEAELASLPRSPLQRTAWWGIGIGVIQCLAILALFLSKGGASAYSEDSTMRMQLLALFLICVATSTILSVVGRRGADELDKWALARAPLSQSIAVLLALAAWNVVLPIRFHDEGAIPTIYSYLMMGSILIVHMYSYFAGVLIGCWSARRHGEG